MRFVYMHVYLSNEHPVPQVPYRWHKNRFSIAEGWDSVYEKYMQMYSDLFSSDIDGCTV